ncbi:uncharacterized protein LODBEIA_P50800 [Lodderomyces beijingensis]|uniref:Acyl-coenzyme A diphosphatase SCS3 n=1 Tax=Lodderomyces beijingensis TaxID=1775926 RepID=A0ABP0ZRS4_9ASCO
MSSSASSIYDVHYAKIQQWSTMLETRFKITLNEVIFLASFLLNFLLSRLIHFGAPEEEVYNYYNDKGNFINQFFVKRGWGWTTLVILVFYVAHVVPKLYSTTRHTNGKSTQEDEPEERNTMVLLKGALRYVLVTAWWYLFTQWCFGLPIMDKVFVFTGGVCTLEQATPQEAHRHHSYHASIARHFIQDLEDSVWKSSSVSSYHCRKIKGNWIGGHDPSGHVFLLIHASLYLFLESAPYFNWSSILAALKRKPRKEKLDDDVVVVVEDKVEVASQLCVVGLISMWWFMLLMTNIYFHSIGEKLVGLVFGYLGIGVIYFVPRWISIPGL